MLDKLAEEARLAAKKKWLATPKRCRGLQLAVVKRMDHRFILLSGYRSLQKPTMGKITGYQAFPTTGQQLTMTLVLPSLGEPFGIDAAFRLWPPDTVKFAVERALRETYLDCERPERDTDEHDVFTIIAWMRSQASTSRSAASTVTAPRLSTDPNPSQGKGVMAAASKAAAAVAAGVMQGLNRMTMGLFGGGGGLGLGPNRTNQQQEPTTDLADSPAHEMTAVVPEQGPDNSDRVDPTLHIGERGWDEGSLTSAPPPLSPHPYTAISPTPVADRVLLAAAADDRVGDGNAVMEGAALIEGGVSALTLPFSPDGDSESQVLGLDRGLGLGAGGASLGGVGDVSVLSLTFSEPGDRLRLDPWYRHVHTAYSVGHSSINNDNNNHNNSNLHINGINVNNNDAYSGRNVGNLLLIPLSLVHARMGDRLEGPSPLISPPVCHPSHPIIIDCTTLPHGKVPGRQVPPVHTTEGEELEGLEAGGVTESGEGVAGADGEEHGKAVEEVQGTRRSAPPLASVQDSERAYYLRMRSFPLSHGLNAFMPEVEGKYFVSAWHNKRWQSKRAQTVHLDASRSLGALYSERDACAYHLLHHFPLINYRQLPPLPPSGWSLAPSDHLILWKEAGIQPSSPQEKEEGVQHTSEGQSELVDVDQQNPAQSELAEDEVVSVLPGSTYITPTLLTITIHPTHLSLSMPTAGQAMVEPEASEDSNSRPVADSHPPSGKPPRRPPPKQASNNVTPDAVPGAKSGDDIAVVRPDDNIDVVASASATATATAPPSGKPPRRPPPKQASNNVTPDAVPGAKSGDDIAVVRPDDNIDVVASATATFPKRPSSHDASTASPRQSDIAAGANAAAESSSSSKSDVREANDGPDNSYLVTDMSNKEHEDEENREEEEDDEDDEDGIAWRRVEMDLADADVLLLPVSPSEIPLQHQQALLQRQQEKLLQHRLQLQQQKLQLQQQLQHHQQQPEVSEPQQQQPDELQSPRTTDPSALPSDPPADIVLDIKSSQKPPSMSLTTDLPDRRSDNLVKGGASEHSNGDDNSEDRRSSEGSNDALPENSTTSPPQEGVSTTILSASASGKRPRGPPPKRPPPKAPPVPTDVVAVASPPEEASEQGQGLEQGQAEDGSGSSIMSQHHVLPAAEEDEEDEEDEEEEEEDNKSVVSANAHSPPGAMASVRFEPSAFASDDAGMITVGEEGSSAVDIDADTIALTVSELNRSGVLKLVRAVGRPHPVALSRTSRRLLPHLHSSPYSSSWLANEQETYLTDRIAPYSKRRMDVQRGVRVANKSIKIDGVHVVYTVYLETTYPGMPPVPWRKEKQRTIWRKPVKGKKAPPGEAVLDFDTDTTHHPVDVQSSLEINPPASVMSLANQLSVHGDRGVNGGPFDSAVVDKPLQSSDLARQPSFASLTDSFVTHPLEARIAIQDEPRTEEEKTKEAELANNPFGGKVSEAGNTKNTDKKGGKTKVEAEEEDGEYDEDEEGDEDEEEEEDDDDSSSSDDEKDDDEGGWLDNEEPEAEEEDLAAMFQRMGDQPVVLESADDLLNEMFDTIAPNAVVAIDLYLPFGVAPRQQQHHPDPDANQSAPHNGAGLPQSTSLRLRMPKEDLFLLVSDRRALLSVALRAAYRGFFDSAGEDETLAVEDSWDLIAHELMHKVRCHETPDQYDDRPITTSPVDLPSQSINQSISVGGRCASPLTLH